MLTYSLSFDKAISIPPLKKIASAKIVEYYWNPEYPEEPEDLLEENWACPLARHREEAIHASVAFAEENNLPSVLKTVLKESVSSLSRAHAQFLRWKYTYDSQDHMGKSNNNLLDARRYFTVDGEFDDLSWTKRLVLDPLHPIKRRFEVACQYCLEKESAALWSEMKYNESVPYNGDLFDIQSCVDEIISIWICHHENRLEDLARRRYPGDDVYAVGFKHAASRGYEYATRYFWEKISEPEKIEDTEFFYLISKSARRREKVPVFLYSKLSKERKQSFSDWSKYDDSLLHSYAWVTLLLSPYTEAERYEIVELVYNLPLVEYAYVLFKIGRGIVEHSYPFNREDVFKTLWIRLAPEERSKVLEKWPCVIRRVIAAIF